MLETAAVPGYNNLVVDEETAEQDVVRRFRPIAGRPVPCAANRQEPKEVDC